jgi:hypothetical protein
MSVATHVSFRSFLRTIYLLLSFFPFYAGNHISMIHYERCCCFLGFALALCFATLSAVKVRDIHWRLSTVNRIYFRDYGLQRSSHVFSYMLTQTVSLFTVLIVIPTFA